MRRLRRHRLFVAIVALFVVAAVGLLFAHRATQQIPKFYAQVVEQQGSEVRESSDVMRRKIAALASETVHPGRFHAKFTAEQINAYLAVDLVEKHPDLLPEEVSSPRVSLEKEAIHIGWKYDSKWAGGIHSISLEPYMAEPNVIALRLRRARAGSLPLPVGEVVDAITELAVDFGLQLHWQQLDGDPVAVVRFPPAEDGDSNECVLETIELDEGSLRLAGQTIQRNENSPQAVILLPTTKTVDRRGDQRKDREKRQQ